MEEEDGYVYKGRAVAVEVVVHERFSSLLDIDDTCNIDDTCDSDDTHKTN